LGNKLLIRIIGVVRSEEMGNTKVLTVVYSTDDNYAQHTGVSIISLFENNKDINKIMIYIIENDISQSNKNKLQAIINDYGRAIQFVDFAVYKKKLQLNLLTPISLSSYGRLFIADMLPPDINTVVYLDCDIIVTQTLKEICEESIEPYYLAAVEDSIADDIKASVGMDIVRRYINAGMRVINLKKWRAENLQERFIEFLKMYNGAVTHHDQGVINGCLNKNIKILHPKFNAMTPLFTMSRKNIIKYYHITGEYYTQQDINEAIKNPVLIHFTAGFTCRPWEMGCSHPKRDLYRKYLEKSPWKDYKLQKESSPFKQRCVKAVYNYLPYCIADYVMQLAYRIRQ
jgi:lipopolysaccharide biosynthesis glycosyltransferase